MGLILVDPVEEHVAKAAEVGTFAAVVGDARELAQGGDSFDVTLMLGPLYHLVEAADRARALREARRVTRPDGLVVAAGISRYAGLLEYGTKGMLIDKLQLFADALETGRNYAPAEDVPRLLPSAIELARLVERDPRVMSASFHFLAFGRA